MGILCNLINFILYIQKHFSEKRPLDFTRCLRSPWCIHKGKHSACTGYWSGKHLQESYEEQLLWSYYELNVVNAHLSVMNWESISVEIRCIVIEVYLRAHIYCSSFINFSNKAITPFSIFTCWFIAESPYLLPNSYYSCHKWQKMSVFAC